MKARWKNDHSPAIDNHEQRWLKASSMNAPRKRVQTYSVKEHSNEFFSIKKISRGQDKDHL